ncbi:MAG: hypothetical protein MO847_00725 [Candidatus Protistobacter heckmanni]|nr:hypothetical protein [Candidatus Protistobacter heckmanni]
MLPAGSQYTSNVYASWYSSNQFKMYQDNNYYKQHNPPQFAEELRNESIFNQPGSSVLAPNLATVDGVQQSAGQASPAVDLRLSAAAQSFIKRNYA